MAEISYGQDPQGDLIVDVGLAGLDGVLHNIARWRGDAGRLERLYLLAHAARLLPIPHSRHRRRQSQKWATCFWPKEVQFERAPTKPQVKGAR
jgi:hypothetical protein